VKNIRIGLTLVFCFAVSACTNGPSTGLPEATASQPSADDSLHSRQKIPAVRIKEIPLPSSNGIPLGGIAVSPTNSAVYLSTYGAGLPAPIPAGERYLNGTFTLMSIETPQFSGFAQGAVAVTSDGVARLATAAVTYDPVGSAAITSYDPTYLVPILSYTNFGGALSPMTADSLGNLWFAGNPYNEDLYGYIARIPEGDIGEPGYDQPVVRLSSSVDSVTGIATDRRGDAWVATGGGAIFHVSAALKVVRAYPVPAGTSIAGIAVGADDAIWFLDSGHNAVGRMTPSGKFTRYAIPTPNSGVSAITLGPDGALWFTENTANRIGRITAGKPVTEYSLPTKNAGPTGIAALGPGCTSPVVWFVEQDVNKLGMLTI
jgi:hypothetical protein